MTTDRPTPTLVDVATRAGVSTATVSRCLNFPDRVKQDTRDKVMAAVDALGYTPNFGARAMASQRTNTIGAIIPTMENAVFARGLQAFEDELRQHGFTLLVASSSYQADVEEAQIRSLIARGADALLLIGHDRDPAIYRFLEGQRKPALVTWAFDPANPRPSVGFDNRAAMRDMADTVLDLHHRKLALISAPMASNDRARARMLGIHDAMAARGLAPDALAVIETPYAIDNGADAFAKLMKSDNRPTAVFCGNDVLAVGALRQARAMGLAVPGDVSITGFDDIELSQVTHPALTTVHVPHRAMGQQAARVLVEMVLQGRPAETIALPTEIRMRGSLAAVDPA